MAAVYIIYSASLDRYYIGFTNTPVLERIEKHNNAFYEQKKFTAKAKDWQLFFCIECNTERQARLIEQHIKKMKSRTYLNSLKEHRELAEKLLQRFETDSSEE